MRFLSKIPPGWAWGAIFALLLTLVLQIGFWLSQPRNRNGGWIHSQITRMPDREVEPWLRGFWESRGEAALPLLVIDLNAARPAVRGAARNVLQAEVAAWRTIPPEQAAVRAGVIATQLRIFPRLSPEAEEVAGFVHAWVISEDCPAADRSRLLVVLHGLPRRRPLVGHDEELRALESAEKPSAPTPAPRTLREVAAAPIIQQTSTAPTPARREEPSVAPPRSESEPAPRLLAPEASEAAAPIDDEWDLGPRPATAEANGGAIVPLPPEPTIDWGAIKQASTRELLAQMHAAGRAAAEHELRSRGFKEDQLELARHLSSPNASERREWTEALPRVSQIDSRAWLVWMTEDVDTSVRRTAVTLLATMNDETAIARLREVAVHDPDPGIRRLAAEGATSE